MCRKIYWRNYTSREVFASPVILNMEVQTIGMQLEVKNKNSTLGEKNCAILTPRRLVHIKIQRVRCTLMDVIYYRYIA
jgi:hypothetical protein